MEKQKDEEYRARGSWRLKSQNPGVGVTSHEQAATVNETPEEQRALPVSQPSIRLVVEAALKGWRKGGQSGHTIREVVGVELFFSRRR